MIWFGFHFFVCEKKLNQGEGKFHTTLNPKAVLNTKRQFIILAGKKYACSVDFTHLSVQLAGESKSKFQTLVVVFSRGLIHTWRVSKYLQQPQDGLLWD